MENTKIYSDKNPDMSLKDINSKVFNMILPITIENVLQMVAGIISMGMVGRIDVLAVSALSIGTRITQIIWALFKGITTGATVYVAQYYGAGSRKKMLSIIQQTLLSSIVIVIILSVLIYFKASALLLVFDPDAKLLASAVIYLKIVVWGLPFLTIMLIVGGVLQGMGKAKTSLIITFIMNVINIIAGYILIFGKIGFSPMGVSGAALATVISQMAAAFIGLFILFNRHGIMASYLCKGFFTIDMGQVKDVYRVGLPSSMESIFWQLAAIILTRAILTYGETPFAAHQLGMQAESISYMPAAGIGIAATAFIGQALGAKDKTLAKTYLKQIVKLAVIITIFTSLILIVFPHPMMSLLTNNKEVVNLGAVYLTLMGIVQLPQNISGVLSGAMRGAGYTKVPMIVAGAGLWGIRVPFTLIVAYLLKRTIVSIWVVMSIDLVFRFVISLILFKKNNIYESTLIS